MPRGKVGLEGEVDSIFLVMKPSKEMAFPDAELGCNLNQPRGTQSAARRSDFAVTE